MNELSQTYTVWFDTNCVYCNFEYKYWLNKVEQLNLQNLSIRNVHNENCNINNSKVTHEQAMSSIVMQVPTGEIYTGFEVFVKLNKLAGGKTVWRFTSIKLVRKILTFLYPYFAKNRYRLQFKKTPKCILGQSKCYCTSKPKRLQIK